MTDEPAPSAPPSPNASTAPSEPSSSTDSGAPPPARPFEGGTVSDSFLLTPAVASRIQIDLKTAAEVLHTEFAGAHSRLDAIEAFLEQKLGFPRNAPKSA